MKTVLPSRLDKDIKPTYHPVYIMVVAFYLTQPDNKFRANATLICT